MLKSQSAVPSAQFDRLAISFETSCLCTSEKISLVQPICRLPNARQLKKICRARRCFRRRRSGAYALAREGVQGDFWAARIVNTHYSSSTSNYFIKMQAGSKIERSRELLQERTQQCSSTVLRYPIQFGIICYNSDFSLQRGHENPLLHVRIAKKRWYVGRRRSCAILRYLLDFGPADQDLLQVLELAGQISTS